MLVLALVFASTFLIAKTTGFLSTENIENLLNAAQTVSPSYIFAVVALLLFADLFIAVPTLTIILLAGFFLGPAGGFSAAVTGLYCAGICGYLISRRYGNILLGAIVKDTAQQQEARESFQSHGFLTILLSRALPILPEVSACMAGLTRMPFFKFLTAWSISTLPYALIGRLRWIHQLGRESTTCHPDGNRIDVIFLDQLADLQKIPAGKECLNRHDFSRALRRSADGDPTRPAGHHQTQTPYSILRLD